MSINSVNLTGRLTRDPDVRYTDGGTDVYKRQLQSIPDLDYTILGSVLVIP